MSQLSINLKITSVYSTANCQPDMCEVIITAAFLKNAEKCVSFLREIKAEHILIDNAFEFELYEEVGPEQFEPCQDDELHSALGGCSARISANGLIEAVISLENDQVIWCDVGMVQHLKEQLEQLRPKKTFSIVSSNYTAVLMAVEGAHFSKGASLGNREVVGTVEAADTEQALEIWKASRA